MFGLPSLPNMSFRASSVGVLGQLTTRAFGILEFDLTWAVYDAETDLPAFAIDNFLSAEIYASTEVANAPITEGSFVSYNKVQRPIEIRLQISQWGLTSTRKSFLDWLEEIRVKAKKFYIVTPETVYRNVTLREYRLNRSTDKATVTRLIADATFVEVREVPTQMFNPETGECNTENAANPEDKNKTVDRHVSPLEKTAEGIKSGIDAVKEQTQKLQKEVSEKIKSIIPSTSRINDLEDATMGD